MLNTTNPSEITGMTPFHSENFPNCVALTSADSTLLIGTVSILVLYNVCMYVCIYVCVFLKRANMYKCLYVSVLIFICGEDVCVCMYFMYVCTYVSIYMYSIYVCMYVCMYVCVF